MVSAGGISHCLLLLLLIAVTSGCSSYNDKVAATRQNWALGSWNAAATTGGKLVEDREGHRNEVLLGLEEGTILRTIDQIPKSQETFESTWSHIQEMDEKAAFQISQASLALLVNPGLTVYQARTYDRIMLHTYSALNYLNLGDYDSARVALNRSYNSQQSAVAENSKKIEKMQNEIEKGRAEDDDDIVDVDKIENNPATQQKLSTLYGEIRSMKPYAAYVNPFSVYLDGLYFLNKATDGSDLERGLKSMERVSQLNPESLWLRSEHELAEQILNGKGQPDSVVVLLETGLSPIREEEKIELPLFLFGSGSVPYFGVSFPVLRFQNNYPAYASVSAGGVTRQTEVISDMDRVIAQEFNDHENLVVTQSIISAATKAAVFYVARSQAKDGSTAQALIDIFGLVYQVVTNQPDLRTWFTLPKQIQGIRLPMPEDRVIRVSFAGSNQNIEILLEDGKILVVHIRVTATANNPVIHQFQLK